MKRKELKKLAQKIAKAEQNLSKAASKEETERYQDEIIRLSGQIDGFEDMLLLDEEIQKILND